MGRNPIGRRAMTNTERQQRHRDQQRLAVLPGRIAKLQDELATLRSELLPAEAKEKASRANRQKR
jgi:hypothetical protein